MSSSDGTRYSPSQIGSFVLTKMKETAGVYFVQSTMCGITRVTHIHTHVHARDAYARTHVHGDVCSL